MVIDGSIIKTFVNGTSLTTNDFLEVSSTVTKLEKIAMPADSSANNIVPCLTQTCAKLLEPLDSSGNAWVKVGGF